MPIGVRLVPHAVEPDAGDVAIAGKQLAKLRVHIVQILIEIASGRPSRGMPRLPERIVVRRMPIELRIIEEQLDALPVAFLGQRLQGIFAIRRSVHDVPLALFGAEHGEAVVVLAGDGDVFHPRALGQRHPGGGIELHRIELRRQLRILGHRHLAVVHNPFAVAEHAVNAPMNEQAELIVLEPPPRLQVLLRWLIILRADRRCRDDRGEKRSRDSHQ